MMGKIDRNQSIQIAGETRLEDGSWKWFGGIPMRLWIATHIMAGNPDRIETYALEIADRLIDAHNNTFDNDANKEKRPPALVPSSKGKK
jgi:hypothetical protein